MDNLYNNKTINTYELFDGNLFNTRMLYAFQFNMLPNIQYVGNIDGEKTYKDVTAKMGGLVLAEHKYRWYNKNKNRSAFDETVVIFQNNCIIGFDTNYCEILHDGWNDEFVSEITAMASKHKERTRKEPLEINLIVNGGNGLHLKEMEIKRTKLDLDLFYEDDFKEVDEVIRQRLSKKKDKGIVLLHGLPGTGKTTYLRYLLGKLKKRVLFLSPSVAGDLMSPHFINLLINNPDTVLIIEDAENIIMDRRTTNNSAVSNLLNISDGLLADFLNVQVICTFNSPLTMVDSALLRKGRLIAKYEFGKLSVKKAQALSYHLGHTHLIKQPMTVAEIANQHEMDFEVKQVQVLGFRRDAIAPSPTLTHEWGRGTVENNSEKIAENKVK